MTDQELEDYVKDRLAIIYDLRMKNLRKLTLAQVLKKNPYLFRAKGANDVPKFVEDILQAYLSSSEETVFGNRFFEPLARKLAEEKGGIKTGSTGTDLEFDTPNKHTVIAVKSAANSQNASAQNKQNSEFIKVNQTVRAKGVAFDAIIGYCYGRVATEVPEGKIYRRIAGQKFWAELSGEEDFYLKILHAMKDYPVIHRAEYDAERAKLVNRLTQGIVLNFVNSEGEVDWDKLLRYNSGAGKPMQLVKIKPNAGTGILTTEEDISTEDISTEEDLEEEPLEEG